jgi:hypothetical protein
VAEIGWPILARGAEFGSTERERPELRVKVRTERNTVRSAANAMTGHAALQRICALALLLLAGSPLTAPFSTCDVADLFGGHDSVAGTVVQAKIGSDTPLPSISAPFRLRAPRQVAFSRVLLLVDRPTGRATPHFPLRL